MSRRPWSKTPRPAAMTASACCDPLFLLLGPLVGIPSSARLSQKREFRSGVETASITALAVQPDHCANHIELLPSGAPSHPVGAPTIARRPLHACRVP